MSVDLVAALEGDVRGRQVLISTLERVEPDPYRIWAGPYVIDGYEYVEIVAERDWWASTLLGAQPDRVLRWPVGAVFVA